MGRVEKCASLADAFGGRNARKIDTHGSYSAPINIDLSVWKSSAGWFATAGNWTRALGPRERVPCPIGPPCTRDAGWGTTVNLRARGWSTGTYIRGCDRELTLRELSHPLPDSHRDYPGRARKRKSRSEGPDPHDRLIDSSTIWFTRGRSWYSWVRTPSFYIRANFHGFYRVIRERWMIVKCNLCLILIGKVSLACPLD